MKIGGDFEKIHCTGLQINLVNLSLRLFRKDGPFV